MRSVARPTGVFIVFLEALEFSLDFCRCDCTASWWEDKLLGCCRLHISWLSFTVFERFSQVSSAWLQNKSSNKSPSELTWLSRKISKLKRRETNMSLCCQSVLNISSRSINVYSPCIDFLTWNTHFPCTSTGPAAPVPRRDDTTECQHQYQGPIGYNL